ncbi:MAG: hypothetical protein V1764_04265 [Nitrospirota bacterium]
MIDMQNLASRIKRNCNISDAHYWGLYSLCGLLLRLRELYRIEKGINPWEKILQKDIGEWISDRESLWRELEDKEYEPISVNGNVYSPFEVERINAELEKEGLVYGAGFGVHMKPSFFIADILSKENVDGYDVYIAGNEYARDLSDHPAMLQDRAIFARVAPTRLLLWARFEEMRWRGLQGALAFAFSKYGITPEEEPSEHIDRKIVEIARSEVETYIYHELGEAFEGKKIGDEWKTFLMHLSYGRAELFSRAVKDILSDTSENGMLRYIIKNQKEGSLGFYIVFLSGLRKVIFPEILDAFKLFVETGDWECIDNARKAGHIKAGEYTERLLTLYRSKTDNASISETIEKGILSGLL